jgi:hypothetical protein
MRKRAQVSSRSFKRTPSHLIGLWLMASPHSFKQVLKDLDNSALGRAAARINSIANQHLLMMAIGCETKRILAIPLSRSQCGVYRGRRILGCPLVICKDLRPLKHG